MFTKGFALHSKHVTCITLFKLLSNIGTIVIPFYTEKNEAERGLRSCQGRARRR